ncbi:hypothetical protein KMZ32_01935 [Phycicoccus sp. MAQZ13P-2]|uniref:hypothetical protein n=1 Tax=Phycicoccus mangrovi TaxID=2840470 RepID=UPI001C0064A0|nr:hypothetical protein [Phycicoccus mangrovi]MBT9254453.1 hypothetical protein [Phycicoccus mangrovi]MBT9272831.1 hypothetical protein [Phycicoccus mangrovi]
MTGRRVDLRGCSPVAATAVKAAGAVVQGHSLADVCELGTGVPTIPLVRAGLHLLDATARAVDDRGRGPGERGLQIVVDPVTDPALLALTRRPPGELESQVVAAMQSLGSADPRGDAVAALASEGEAAVLVIATLTARLVAAGGLDAFVAGVDGLRAQDAARSGDWSR